MSRAPIGHMKRAVVDAVASSRTSTRARTVDGDDDVDARASWRELAGASGREGDMTAAAGSEARRRASAERRATGGNATTRRR